MNTREDVMYKCEFADDVALLAITHTAAEAAISAYSSEVRNFGSMVSTPKMKFLVVGHGVQEEELLPISINSGTRVHKGVSISGFIYRSKWQNRC